jgi:hypothetical protein
MKEPSMKPANPRTLTINGGSASITFAQYQLGDTLNRSPHGTVDRTGMSGTNLTFHLPAANHQDSRRLVQGSEPFTTAVAFSYARAIQQPALETGRGKDSQVVEAQKALCHRARCNRAARRGKYSAGMEDYLGAKAIGGLCQ